MFVSGSEEVVSIEHVSLSDQQRSAFDAFKSKCAEDGLLDKPEDLGADDTCDGINDDVVLLRFLRARKYDVDEAYKMFSAVWLTRSKCHHCTFYDKLDVQAYDETRKMYPHWSGRLDKLGQPVCYFDVEAVTSKTLAAQRKTSEALNIPGMDLPKSTSIDSLRSVAIFDNAVRFVLPLCSAMPIRVNPETPITKAVYVVDISTISLAQVWSIRSWIKAVTALLADTYPEIVDKILIIGAPSYMPTIWNWVKGWIDPVTASKIQYLNPADVLTTLTSHIEIANVPKRYGGELDFECGMLPDLDPIIKEMLGGKQYPPGPVKWIQGEGGDRIAVAVGSANGRKRYDRLSTVKSRQLESLHAGSAEDGTFGDEKEGLSGGIKSAGEVPAVA